MWNDFTQQFWSSTIDGLTNGAIYGLASHGKWHGAFKPANRHRDLKNLYLAGGSAHPGPGMPMALMSVSMMLNGPPSPACG